MNKDIEFPSVKNVIVAVIPDNEDLQSPWKVYLINTGSTIISNVMVTSTGFGKLKDEMQKTSTLRYSFTEIKGNGFEQIELIDPSVFHLNNEYWISFWIDDKLFDKRYLFVPDSLSEQHFTEIPVIGEKGILHE
ncbi:MAG: hypothetical protein NWQ46_01940 [Spirosomaceae bacterium]|nr:hypothetical protein [Spirosomataceae bacterium]MDP5139650.1 hypothetical protein [Spirosomataceae bacterium]